LVGALGVTLAIAVISLFLILVGSEYSGISATRTCSIGNQCVDTKQFASKFVPEPVAAIPLLMAVAVIVGLVDKRMILAWSGTALLFIFSFVTGFSIGLFYMPFAVALVGLLTVIQNYKNPS